MNIAAINIHVQGFGEHKLSFLCDKCPRVQLLGSMLAACLVKKQKQKKLPNYFKGGCTILYSHHQCLSDLVSPPPH